MHLDVGNVRAWPRMTTDQLARLFPNGETLHLPSDGTPLSGYQVALARLGRDGKGGSSSVLAYAPNDDGREEEAGSGRSVLASLFGSRDEAPQTEEVPIKTKAEDEKPLIVASLPQQSRTEQPAQRVAMQIPQPQRRPQGLITAEIVATAENAFPTCQAQQFRHHLSGQMS